VDILPQTPDDLLPVVYHTVAWQYFPPETRRRVLAAMAAFGRDRPLARIAMEVDGASLGAASVLTIWPGTGESARETPLGRVDFHGRWIDWQGPVRLE
jgi:hypothetical protein